MLLRVHGVVEDGDPRASWVPESTAYAIEVSRGLRVTMQLQVTSPSGAPYDPALWTALWTARKTFESAAIFAKTGVENKLAGKGRWDFTILPADLRSKTPGQYIHDIWLVNIADTTIRELVVPPSSFSLLPSIVAVP